MGGLALLLSRIDSFHVEVAEVAAAVVVLAGIGHDGFRDHHGRVLRGGLEHGRALALDHGVGSFPAHLVVVAAAAHEAINLGALSAGFVASQGSARQCGPAQGSKRKGCSQPKQPAVAGQGEAHAEAGERHWVSHRIDRCPRDPGADQSAGRGWNVPVAQQQPHR